MNQTLTSSLFMSKPGYNKGRGNLKKVIFHHPTTDQTFEFTPPPFQPKKTNAKNKINSHPQTSHQDMEQTQQMNIDSFNHQETTQIIDFSNDLNFSETSFYNFQDQNVLENMFFNDDPFFIENCSRDSPLFDSI